MDGIDDIDDLEGYGDDVLSSEGPSDDFFEHDPILTGGESEFESSYDTSTREGREKLAKDIHQALTGESVLGSSILMRNSYTNPLSREDFRKEVEQNAYELVMEDGAHSRTVSGNSVIDSMNQAAGEVNQQDSILGGYSLDEDLEYPGTDF